ncbi:MAG: NIPSNAP family protein [Bacteroidota bacterium]
MDRRTFIYSSAAATSVLPLSSFGHTPSPSEERELYEIRTYDILFRGNKGLLINYLREALYPLLQEKGAKHLMIMEEIGQSTPVKLWVLIAWKDAGSYLAGQAVSANDSTNELAATYEAVPHDQPIYSRFESWLLWAFEGMPQMNKGEGSELFELRTYEGYSEDAVARKIRMFNKEEIVLFHKTGLHPVFFGEMLAGPYRPCLTYMLHFNNMEERDANWASFLKHPDWNEMKNKEEYAHTVSNIRRVFLKKA